MCGIAGFLHRRTFHVETSKAIATEMIEAIKHRGPDALGVWADDFVALSHARLSILDLSDAGLQPMVSSSGRYVLVFNGEIYNHNEIRADIKKVNFSNNWRGSSDTETLAEAIDAFGLVEAVQKINGMFALAIWDRKEQLLHLCRDRLGEKPLYYGWVGTGLKRSFVFASELKSILKHPLFEKNINQNSLGSFMRRGYVPDPNCIYQGIYKLLPAHHITLSQRSLFENLLPTSKSYWSLSNAAQLGVASSVNFSVEGISEKFESLLKSAVRKQMLSDVPLGAFLSGGLDSSLIVSLMQEQSIKPVKTFTIGFENNNYNEAPFAKSVSDYLGTEHFELYVNQRDALNVIPLLPKIYDEPFSDSSQIPSFLISHLAKEHVKVVLTGDGGDEVFGGYNRYLAVEGLWKSIQGLPLSLRKNVASIISMFPEERLNRIAKHLPILNKYSNFGEKLKKTAGAIQQDTVGDLYNYFSSQWFDSAVMNSPVKDLLVHDVFLSGEFIDFDNAQKMMLVDSLTYLPGDILTKVDRASMANSLETRAPFLDRDIVEFAWQIPQKFKISKGQGKWIMRQQLFKRVPETMFDRPKMGFSVPIGNWLKGELRDWADSLINASRINAEGVFDATIVQEKWDEHLSGKKNWENQLWTILMFQAWKDEYF
ncbi:asparagine synthase (glutamine-hydrolyzing) [Alphaproteobacteria bacterium]|nr:asparagine synthase (glutamine-hydrolyzing) [Alphaproteobacteria bacterium]